MSVLELVPGVGYVNPEYLRNFNSDVCLIGTYANNPTAVDPKHRFGFRHYCALNSARLIELDPIKYFKIKLHFQVLECHYANLITLVDEINHHLQQLQSKGLKYDDNQKNTYMLEALKEEFPDITEKELIKGYKLSTDLEMLKGGITYEEISLDDLVERYRQVPEDIKKEYNVGQL